MESICERIFNELKKNSVHPKKMEKAEVPEIVRYDSEKERFSIDGVTTRWFNPFPQKFKDTKYLPQSEIMYSPEAFLYDGRTNTIEYENNLREFFFNIFSTAMDKGATYIELHKNKMLDIQTISDINYPHLKKFKTKVTFYRPIR